jgi:sigma-E factor negative regulatory protein RseC
MSSEIKHSGVVESVAEGLVRVRILQTSACAACKVASHCHASEAKEKIVDVSCSDAAAYVTGQTVTVCASADVARKALLLGFGLPLLILLGVVLLLTWCGYDEATAALASIAMLAPYYLLLWLLRRRISQQLSFYLKS